MENQDINYVQEWIDKDEKLSKILVEIQESPISVEKQAEMAFHRIAEVYNLPKMPQDVDNNTEAEATSVYEHLGLLNYLNPHGDPRGNVLSALFFSKYKWEVDSNLILAKAKKDGVDNKTAKRIGFLGKNHDVKIIFIKENESWFDLGCNYFIKLT